MDTLERRVLGEAGLTYVRERVARGRTLSRLLLEGLDLASGSAWAYLPCAMSDAQALRFAASGLTHLATGMPPEVFERPDGHWEVVHNPVEPLLAAQVGDFLKQEPCGVAVWEDPLASARDRWVHDEMEASLLFVGDEVYHVLTPSSVSPTAVAAGLEVMGAWWGSPAVLAALPAEALSPFVSPRAAVAPQQLQVLVDYCRLLFFLAYDGEGYVLWSPGGVGNADTGAESDSKRLSERGP